MPDPCAPRVLPGRAVDPRTAGDPLAYATAPRLLDVAAAAQRARRARGRLGAADAWAASGLDAALDALERPPAAPLAVEDLPPGAGVATAAGCPQIALRHAYRAGRRPEAAQALADLFAGAVGGQLLELADQVLDHLPAPPVGWAP